MAAAMADAPLPAPVVFVQMADLPRHQSDAIQNWVNERIEVQLQSRLELTGRAIPFLRDVDAQSNVITKEVNAQADRVSEQVTRLNEPHTSLTTQWQGLHERLEASFGGMQIKWNELETKLEATFADVESKTRANADTTAALNAQASEAVRTVTTETAAVKTDLEKTKADIIVEFNKLNKGVVNWSNEYAKTIDDKVRAITAGAAGGASPTHAAKHDKKDLVVWKLSDGVGKAGSRALIPGWRRNMGSSTRIWYFRKSSVCRRRSPLSSSRSASTRSTRSTTARRAPGRRLA